MKNFETNYKMNFLDKSDFKTLKEAKRAAKKAYATTRLKDLHKIIVTCITIDLNGNRYNVRH